jgi:hypothetical protein
MEPILMLTPRSSLCSPLPRSLSRRDAVPANATTPGAKAQLGRQKIFGGLLDRLDDHAS